MDSHQLGFARPPTEMQRVEQERQAERDKQDADERIGLALEEKELRMKVHAEYWGSLKDNEKPSMANNDKGIVEEAVVSRPASRGAMAIPAAVTSAAAIARKPKSKTERMWQRARKAALSNQSVATANMATSDGAAPSSILRAKKDKDAELAENSAAIGVTFFPATRPESLDVAGEVFYPSFRAKPSVSFLPAEHPDRPTLLAELAAEKAKEQAEGDAGKRRMGRRKNETDAAAIVSDPFIAYGISDARWKKVSNV